MRRIVQEAAARFDWVIIHTPPVGFLSDANLLVAMVDAALFVVRAGKSPYRLIQRALDAIGRDGILGVVLNVVDENVDVAGYSYYGGPRNATRRVAGNALRDDARQAFRRRGRFPRPPVQLSWRRPSSSETSL